MQARSALGHDLRKANQIGKFHGAEQPLRQRQHGARANLLFGQAVGDIAFTVFAHGVQHSALQRHAHIAADERRHGLPIRECVDQPALRAVIVMGERAPDIPNDALVQRRNIFHGKGSPSE